MSKKWLIGMAIAAGALAATALAAVQSQTASKTGHGGAVADLSGSWRLDVSKSDPRGPGGPGRFRGRMGGRGPEGGGGGFGGGRWEGSPGEGRQEGGRGAGRGRRLPDFFQVTQRGGVVTFADSTGSVFQEIRTDGPTAPAGPDQNGPRELTGRWDNGTLIAEWSAPWGGTVVQKTSLSDHGKTLEIRTERNGGASNGPRRARGEMKRVYRRVS